MDVLNYDGLTKERKMVKTAMMQFQLQPLPYWYGVFAIAVESSEEFLG